MVCRQAPATENVQRTVAGAWWHAVGAPLDRLVRPRISRSEEELRTLEAVPMRRTRKGTAGSARQRDECSAGSGGGKRDACRPREEEAGADLKEASHFALAFSARPNVRGKGAPAARRQALTGENVPCTTGQGLVVCRWRSL